MSSDPIDFKYAMICQISSNVFCLFYPLASSFFFHFDFLGSTFPIFCFKNKNFLKTDIKIQNKTMKSLRFLFQFFPPSFVCHQTYLLSYEHLIFCLVLFCFHRIEESFSSISTTFFFFFFNLLLCVESLTSHY